MTRSELRHALYRAKNGIFEQSKQHIFDMVEPLIPINESWATFAKNWDVFYNKNVVTVIKPETDYDFIHSTCLEKSICERNGIKIELTERKQNVIQIVELCMLEGKMIWPEYNTVWGVSVDHDLRRINTRLFVTSVNSVTEDMIKASAPSDGSAMSKFPELDTVVLDEFETISKEEFDSMVTKTKKLRKGKE